MPPSLNWAESTFWKQHKSVNCGHTARPYHMPCSRMEHRTSGNPGTSQGTVCRGCQSMWTVGSRPAATKYRSRW